MFFISIGVDLPSIIKINFSPSFTSETPAIKKREVIIFESSASIFSGYNFTPPEFIIESKRPNHSKWVSEIKSIISFVKTISLETSGALIIKQFRAS